MIQWKILYFPLFSDLSPEAICGREAGLVSRLFTENERNKRPNACFVTIKYVFYKKNRKFAARNKNLKNKQHKK